MKKALKAFISYSAKDIAYLNELLKDFAPLASAGSIELLHDGILKAGDQWSEMLTRFIREADIIFYLVSPDALASVHVQKEIETGLSKYKDGTGKIIPVLLRDCDWQSSPLATFYFIPRNGRSLENLGPEERAVIFTEIRTTVMQIVEESGEDWEVVINRELEQKTGTLNLSNYELTTIPGKIVEMNWLHSLILTNNNIEDISVLGRLTNLESLYLSSNKVSAVGDLKGLSRLNFLDLNDNAIKEIDSINELNLTILYLHKNGIEKIPSLSNLSRLEELDLSGNKIQKMEGLSALKQLKVLNLSDNLITFIEGLTELTSLIDLRMTGNRVESISGLESLQQLTCLDLYRNQVSVITGLENNKRLKLLGLSSNRISILENISHLQDLETLYIAHNSIEDITELQNLSKLKRVVLTNNKITDLFPLKQFIEKAIPVKPEYSFNATETGFFVKDNPIQYPPLEVLLQGNAAILRNFKQQEDALEEQLGPYQSNEVKLILIGNANVGKTHIATYIRTTRQELPLNNASTHGMSNEFVNYMMPFSATPVKMRILDFGGQEYYHDTHHLFFTNDTIYLLLWEKESNRFGVKTEKRYSVKTSQEEEETNTVFPVAYWLDAVNFFITKKEKQRINGQAVKAAADLPGALNIDPAVILVETKRNKKGISLLDTTAILPYRHLIHSQVGISLYRNEVNGQTIIVNTGTESLFDNLNNLISGLFEKRWSGYYALIIQYFEHPEDPNNADLQYIAKPNKLIFDLQTCITLFNRIILKNQYKYRFDNENAEDLCRFLANRGYILYFNNEKICLHPDMLTKEIYGVLNKDHNSVGIISGSEAAASDQAVISIMQDFKILIPHPSGSGYIAPQLLPDNTNSQLNLFMDVFKPALIRFSFTGYIHKNIIQELFYSFRESLLKDDTQNYIWKNGFIVKIENDLYKININSNEQSRSIEIQCLNSFNYRIMNQISNLVAGTLEGRVFTREVSTDGKLFVPADLILGNLQLSQIVFEKKLLRIADYRNFFDNTSRQYALKKLFISYSSKNTDFMKRFVTHLEPLKRNGDIDYWHDRMIEPGTKWDESIKKEMELSDIIIFLLSPDFIATNYIFEVEIPQALAQMTAQVSKLFFVELQACSWERTNLAQIQQTVNPAGDNKAIISIGEPHNDSQWIKVITELEKKWKS